MNRIVVALFFIALACGQDNIPIQFSQLNYNFLFKPLNNGGVDSSPNGLATGGARAIFILKSCMFDAWAAYQPNVIPSHPNNTIPKVANATPADINKSIAFAAYRAMARFWRDGPTDMNDLNNFFAGLGYDRNDNNLNTNNAAGIGNLVANNILTSRMRDGYNENGDEPGAFYPTGIPWKDYTNYRAANAPYSVGNSDCSAISQPTAWVPLQLPNGAQGFSSIFMQKVKPFALSSPFEFPMPGPNMPNTTSSTTFYNELNEVIYYGSILNDTLKVISEFWARSSGAAMWEGITIQTARNAGLSLDDTIKLFFAQGIAAFDSGISCWSYKRLYNSMRPVTAVPCFAQTQTITSWKGKYEGVGLINITDYQSYLVTPPFSEYPSGHSTWSGSMSVILRNFFNGSDVFRGDPVVFLEGSSSTEPKITSGAGYIPGKTDVPNSGPASVGYVPATNITLMWPTWTAAMNEAGVSRLYGGFHFKAGDEDAKTLGIQIGQKAWRVAQSYWNPQTPQPCPTASTTGDADSQSPSTSSASVLAVSAAALIALAAF